MSKNVWADLEATLENRQKYPADMGFQPLSDKFGNQPIGKAPWLKQYLQFRLLNEGVADHGSIVEAKRCRLGAE